MIDEIIQIGDKLDQPKYIYAFKFKKIGVFSNIITGAENPIKRLSVIKRGLAMNPESYDGVKGTEYYCLGVYDDVSGKIIPCCEYMCDCDQVYENLADALGLTKEDKKEVSDHE